MMELAAVIDLLKARRSSITRESAAFSRLTLQLLADGDPVTPECLAEVSGQQVELIRSTFATMQKGSCESDDQGALVGSALTLIPTPHRFRVNSRELYAWCALDTLFLPALIEQTAEVESTCPVTGPQGDFCGQIFFFTSPEAAAAWTGNRSGLAILSAADAFTLAHAVYVDRVTLSRERGS